MNSQVEAALTPLLSRLLVGLDVLEQVARHLHPPRLPQLVAAAEEFRGPLHDALTEVAGIPDEPNEVVAQAIAAAEDAIRAFDELAGAVERSQPTFAAYRAIGYATRATEQLYPLAQVSPPVSRWFLDPDRRDDDALLEALAAGSRRERSSEAPVGILHAGNEFESRGGFSVYVPESSVAERDQPRPMPLVVALHGGSGHGRRFLWSWVRTARTRGAVVLSPTSIAETWSLMDPDLDGGNLDAMVAFVAERWTIDPTRVLVTGMSDGGTFSYLAGLRSSTAFTHLAPCAASFHPMLLAMAEPERLAGLPIRILHGELDWMFPIDVARTARDTLTAVGAEVSYCEIGDLSHTYPADENPGILDWLGA